MQVPSPIVTSYPPCVETKNLLASEVRGLKLFIKRLHHVGSDKGIGCPICEVKFDMVSGSRRLNTSYDDGKS